MRSMLPDLERLPTIVTPRTKLRWLTPDDAPALFEIFSDPEVCRYWSRDPMRSMEDAEALQREIAGYFAERSLFQWGVAEADSDRIIGTCTLAALSPQH